MCIDGLRQEWLEAGSVRTETLSGFTLAISAAQIDATELAANSVDSSEIAADAVIVGKIDETVYQAGSDVLSSGSRWVAFGTAFSNANYFAVAGANAGIAAEPYSVIGTGSKAAGSVLFMGSPAAATFNWVAIAGN